jgi:hypothetical protein
VHEDILIHRVTLVWSKYTQHEINLKKNKGEGIYVCSYDFRGNHKPCFICTICSVFFGGGGGGAHGELKIKKSEYTTKILLTCKQNVEKNTEKLMQDRGGLRAIMKTGENLINLS